MHSGWYWTDESFRRGWNEAMSGEVYPQETLWDDTDKFIASLFEELSDAMEDDTAPLVYLNDDKESGNESKG